MLCLLCIAAAALARAPGRLIGFTAIPFGLLVLQTVLFVIAGLAGSTPEKTKVAGQIILGLHAVNGLCHPRGQRSCCSCGPGGSLAGRLVPSEATSSQAAPAASGG